VTHPLVYTLLALLFLTWGGNWICRQIFWLTGLEAATANAVPASHSAGWIIGALERLILAAGIVAQSWEILAAVVALKTVARFQRMDQQEFAEYFLVGSLFSLLWAMIVTSAWLIVDTRAGGHVRQGIVAALGRDQPDQPCPPCSGTLEKPRRHARQA
jgi:hypothetical protein